MNHVFKGYPPAETQAAIAVLEKAKELIISYAGLTLQEPEMFPQPSGFVSPSSLKLPKHSTSSPNIGNRWAQSNS